MTEEWTIIQNYRKDSKRKINLLKDYSNNKTFLEMCNKKKCCENGFRNDIKIKILMDIY
jgi:hypothetical protein